MVQYGSRLQQGCESAVGKQCSDLPAKVRPCSSSYALSNIDFGVIKKTYVGEGKEIQFRAEFLNFLNHPLLFTGAINVNPTQPAFGQVTATTQANYPRRFQMTFKYVF